MSLFRWELAKWWLEYTLPEQDQGMENEACAIVLVLYNLHYFIFTFAFLFFFYDNLLVLFSNCNSVIYLFEEFEK